MRELFQMSLTQMSELRDCFLTPLLCRIHSSKSVFCGEGRANGLWFPRELGWKKAQRENIQLWFPLTYLGCYCTALRMGQKTMLGRNTKWWEAGNCGGQTPEVQAPLSDKFQKKKKRNHLKFARIHTSCVVIAYCQVTVHYQFTLSEESALRSLQAASISRPWGEHRR